MTEYAGINFNLENKIEELNGSIKTIMPDHAIKMLDLYICCDARKDVCPYSMKIDINTKYVSFSQDVCAYNMRKK